MASPQKSTRRSPRLAQKDKKVNASPRIPEQTALSELYSFRRSMSPSPPPLGQYMPYATPPPPVKDFGDVYSHDRYEPLVHSVASPRYVSPEPDELLRLQTHIPRATTPGWDCEGKSRAPTPAPSHLRFTDIESMTPPPSPRPCKRQLDADARQSHHRAKTRSSRRSLAGVE
ncbi:hypothetical protein CPB85DRAFT_1256715 [Mucidula mucida]|nr:hypothetical protein CPB85DRAFT_1256715 [Mucidula mucida]